MCITGIVQAYRNRLTRAATEAGIIDSSIVRVLKHRAATSSEPDVTVTCTKCSEVKPKFHFSKTQLEADSPRCKVCIARANKQSDPILENVRGLTVNQICQQLLEEVGSRIVLNQAIVGERLRRLAEEGIVVIDSSGSIQFSALPAQELPESQSVCLANRLFLLVLCVCFNNAECCPLGPSLTSES
jgi:hypothetical protein